MEFVKLHTILVIAHVMALTLGLGAALIADMTVARRALFRSISTDTVETIKFLGQIVTAGLVLIWVTGIALVAEMTLSGGTLLTNPKFWAKVVIVEVLTINAVAVHSIVMPMLKAQVGRRLFDGTSVVERVAMGLIGAISLTSWIFPVFLGSARELNHIVPLSGILAIYGICLAAVASGAIIVTMSMSRKVFGETTGASVQQDYSADISASLPSMAMANYSQATNYTPAPHYSSRFNAAAPVGAQAPSLSHNHATDIDLVRALALIAAYEQERSSLASAAAMRVTAQQAAFQQTVATHATSDQRPMPALMTDQTPSRQLDNIAGKITAGQFTLQEIAPPRNELMQPSPNARIMPMFSLPPLPPARPMNTAVLTPRPQSGSASAFNNSPTH